MTGRVLVTGANGHVGNNLARALLDRGYEVRCTVRDADDPARTTHLARHGISDIVSLDVTDGARFCDVADGVDTLFHAAATYRIWTGSEDANRQMIRDSINGATNAVRAAADNGVRRLVLTASVAALPFSDSPDAIVDESQWRTDLRVPYFRAKTEAEQAAWRLAGELGVDLVTILPGVIIGPGFWRRTTSTKVIENVMLGAFRTGVPNSNLPLVDIRDVVNGHIRAAETDCDGRFILCNDHLPSFVEIVDLMHRIDPAVPRAWGTYPDVLLAFGPLLDRVNGWLLGSNRILTGEYIASMRGQWWAYSNARAKEKLGWRQDVPLETSLSDTMERIRELRSR